MRCWTINEVLDDEVLEGWTINLRIHNRSDIPDLGDLLARIGHLVGALRLPGEFDDMNFLAIMLHCPNLRMLDLQMPKPIFSHNPPGSTALIVCFLQCCKQCEELVLRGFGKVTDDVISIAQFCSNLKRITFPDWDDDESNILEALGILLAECPSLDFIQVDSVSYDRCSMTLRLKEDRYDNPLSSMYLAEVLYECDDMRHLTASHITLWDVVISEYAPTLITIEHG